MDDKFGVPAGWYPDPLGLPQLRWWDAQAWTEHTSEARAPMVVQPAARVTLDEVALPSRREQRERERREGTVIESELESTTDTTDEGELSAQPLLAMTLRELEPPLEDTVDQATPGPRRASSHTNALPLAPALSPLAEELAPKRAIKTMQTYTGAVWAIALMPVIQLAVLVVIVLTGLGANLPLVLTVLFAPYLLVVGFAAYDKLLLQVWGHENPARARWAFLAAPGYLVARAVSTVKQTGRGFAPLAVLGSAATAVLAGVLILPGLLIAVFPANFAAEVERSVTADAAALGASLAVVCPAPPLRIGDTVTCVATKPSGATDSIVVSLQRQNGWIAWKVQDWGNWVLTAP